MGASPASGRWRSSSFRDHNSRLETLSRALGRTIGSCGVARLEPRDGPKSDVGGRGKDEKRSQCPNMKKPDALGAGGGAPGPTWRGWGIDAALREPMSMPTMIVANDVPRKLAENFSRGSLNVLPRAVAGPPA